MTAAAQVADGFAALGDPHRLVIVGDLARRGALSTVRLGERAPGVSRQGLTKHLHVLERAGLIESFRRGRDRLWQLRADQLTPLRAHLDQISAEWDARLERLARHLDGLGVM